uniref:Uncharacterized protein n=1 Tax=Oryza punctata TaxID=4537 RepID=A0A0E0MFU6_ORYPU
MRRCRPWYRALFWSVPSPEEGAIVVPVPWAPPGISDEEINAILKTTAATSSVRLSPDLVMFYRPAEGNTAEVLVASRDYVGYVDVAGKPDCRRAVSLLAQHAVLSTTSSFGTDDDGCIRHELGDDLQLIKRMHTSSS